MNSEGTILDVKNLSVTLDGEQILHDISFSVKKGEALAVIGPNGAGKTVLFKALLGLLPKQGEVNWLEGLRIGYVPQRFFVDKAIPLTVREFFLLKSPYFWFPSKSFVGHLNHELSLVGLDEKIMDKQLAEISGGQFQRVAVSWAMLNHPDVLLFDEPTVGIDIGAQETIYNIMHRLQDERGTTILLISHELNIVYRYAQSVLCLNKKRICYGPPVEVLNPKELSALYGEGGFYHHPEHK
ncbi:MAG: metal ABC transporter ATP-binding protein [bacterium]|nr:metal ABC transporter ATP-binding protein [bacterium]